MAFGPQTDDKVALRLVLPSVLRWTVFFLQRQATDSGGSAFPHRLNDGRASRNSPSLGRKRDHAPSHSLSLSSRFARNVQHSRRHQRVPLEERDGFGKFPLDVLLEFCQANGRWGEESLKDDGRSSLSGSKRSRWSRWASEQCLNVRRHTVLATVSSALMTLPALSNLILVPTGASSRVAVMTSTDSQSAHSELSASPRKPSVRTESRSLKVLSLDVWCLRAAHTRPVEGGRETTSSATRPYQS